MEFESPLGNIQHNQPQQKTYTIKDPEQELAELFGTPIAQEQLKPSDIKSTIQDLNQRLQNGGVSNSPPPPPPQPPVPQTRFQQPLLNQDLPVHQASQDKFALLKTFLGMRTDQDVIHYGPMTLAVRTLFAWEQKEVHQIYSNNGLNVIDIQVQTLARAIISMNDVPFEEIVKSDNIDQKASFWYQFNTVIMTDIYTLYQQFIEGLRNKYLNKKNPFEVLKEVQEEIKKAATIQNSNS